MSDVFEAVGRMVEWQWERDLDRIERERDRELEELERRQATTLNTTLARLSLTTTAAGHGRKHVILDGHVLFTGRADEVWAWLRETGRI